MDSLAASRCCAPILRRTYPMANPTTEYHVETVCGPMHDDLSFATIVRIYDAGYAMKHRTVKMAIREKLEISKPRTSGFGCDRLGFENQDLSEWLKLVVGGAEESQAGSAPNSFLFRVRRKRFAPMSGATGLSIGRGLETSYLVGTCSMSREFKGEEVESHPTFVGM